MALSCETRSKLFFYGIIVAITLPIYLILNPWGVVETMDSYAGYSGRVINKGMEWNLFDHGSSSFYYLLLEDADGHREKRFVTSWDYFNCPTGAQVTKKKGFSERITWTDQTLTEKEMINRAKELGVTIPSHPPWSFFLVALAVVLIIRWVVRWSRSDITTD